MPQKPVTTIWSQLPKWAPTFLLLSLCTMVGYAIFDNREVSFYPPKIMPRLDTIRIKDTVRFETKSTNPCSTSSLSIDKSFIEMNGNNNRVGDSK
ncbi:MAG: hypothetical protein IPK03_16535 [Bacteroidetes bacterium]|nr:hypothetical protein [Bacteroidota bacterium]